MRPMVKVKKWDRVKNDMIQRRTGIEETFEEKLSRKVLQWFGRSSYCGRSTVETKT